MSRSNGRQPHNGCAYSFTPRTPAQHLALKLYETCDVLFLTGAAGSGKSQVAVALAARDILSARVKSLILCRPAVESRGLGKGLGFLPGDIAEKTAPYVKHLHKLLDKVTYGFPKDKIHVEPLEYLRGETFEDAIVLLDEAQNCSLAQLKLFLTRLGKNAKILITADPSQSDVTSTVRDYDTDLDFVLDQIEDLPGVGIVEFQEGDVVRHPLVREFLRRL